MIDSSTTDKAEKQETMPESDPNKREVAIEDGSLRGLVQEFALKMDRFGSGRYI